MNRFAARFPHMEVSDHMGPSIGLEAFMARSALEKENRNENPSNRLGSAVHSPDGDECFGSESRH